MRTSAQMLANMMMERIDAQAKEDGQAFTDAMLNHFIVTYNFLYQLDPQILKGLTMALQLHCSGKTDNSNFREAMHRISYDMQLTYDHQTGELPVH